MLVTRRNIEERIAVLESMFTEIGRESGYSLGKGRESGTDYVEIEFKLRELFDSPAELEYRIRPSDKLERISINSGDKDVRTILGFTDAPLKPVLFLNGLENQVLDAVLRPCRKHLLELARKDGAVTDLDGGEDVLIYGDWKTAIAVPLVAAHPEYRPINSSASLISLPPKYAAPVIKELFQAATTFGEVLKSERYTKQRASMTAQVSRLLAYAELKPVGRT